MLKTNREQLVCQSVIGEITSPLGGINPYRINPEGHSDIYPGVGGITYNLRIGDRACGLFADHVEPGVSISNFTQFQGQPGPNRALNLYSCAGNPATVVSGEAKGEKGRVTGKHGGIEHVLLDFPPEVLEKLVIGDKIQIKAFGCGLRLIDFPGIKIINLDPDLLAKLPLKKGKNGKLLVPVTHRVPAAIMGSGIGSPHSNSGDYDIQLFDRPTVEKYQLKDLRLGDLVAIIDADASYGRIYRSGGVVIGIIVHSDCVLAGHGPGVMVVMAAGGGEIEPVIDDKANLAHYLPKL
ncbi:DUF4438 domain-containing protein [Desulfurivibrio dismutans]|uniref:DUF4438 domain-containing protein n=1 Tax=Desulfurivibrio dismutans TaxID=1398908 RepID=UPI0023DB4E6A|nr:DUF4438 domain-containing protein [Desulfurivibrio alkaliphilus]MDF1615589.1 DUF4438 domain-containing protein [Desulfurivibrio alkaliphilus]